MEVEVVDFSTELNRWKQAFKQKKEVDYSDQFKMFQQNIQRFPNFANLIIQEKNQAQREEFFKWTIRDGNCSEKKMRLFIECPKSYQKIKSCYLSRWIGKAEDEDFEIKKGKVKLKFDGRLINFDKEDKEVEFQNGYMTTVRKVVECLKNKSITAGDFIFVPRRGFINFNSYKGAWLTSEGYDSVAHGELDLFTRLPILQTKTLVEMQKMFPNHQIDKASHLFIVHCTKENMDEPMDVMKTHAMMDVVIPDEDGRFHFYHFGAYPQDYPVNKISQFFFMANTTQGVISSADENCVYEHRAHSLLVKPLDKEQFYRLKISLKKMMKWNFDGKLAFQFLVNGCGKFVDDMHYMTFGERLGILQTSVTHARPEGVIGKVIKMMDVAKQKWYYLGIAIFYVVTTIMLGFRSRRAIYVPRQFQSHELRAQLKEIKSLQKVSLWTRVEHDLIMHHPTKIDEQEGVYHH